MLPGSNQVIFFFFHCFLSLVGIWGFNSWQYRGVLNKKQSLSSLNPLASLFCLAAWAQCRMWSHGGSYCPVEPCKAATYRLLFPTFTTAVVARVTLVAAEIWCQELKLHVGRKRELTPQIGFYILFFILRMDGNQVGYHFNGKTPQLIKNKAKKREKRQWYAVCLVGDILFTNASLSLKQHTLGQFSFQYKSVCLRRCSWFTVWTSSELLLESKRGPRF